MDNEFYNYPGEESHDSNQQQPETIIVNNNVIEMPTNEVGRVGYIISIISIFIPLLWFIGGLLSFIGLFSTPKTQAKKGCIITIISLFFWVYLLYKLLCGMDSLISGWNNDIKSIENAEPVIVDNDEKLDIGGAGDYETDEEFEEEAEYVVDYDAYPDSAAFVDFIKRIYQIGDLDDKEIMSEHFYNRVCAAGIFEDENLWKQFANQGFWKYPNGQLNSKIIDIVFWGGTIYLDAPACGADVVLENCEGNTKKIFIACSVDTLKDENNGRFEVDDIYDDDGNIYQLLKDTTY